MTVIAWDGEELAADKRAVSNGLSRTTTKIWRVGNELVAGSGYGGQIAEMLAWYSTGADPAKFPPTQRKDEDRCTFVVIGQDRKIRDYASTPYPIILEDRTFATGSGRDYAMMAMYMGLTAKEAVARTCDLDVDCGNGVDVLRLEG